MADQTIFAIDPGNEESGWCVWDGCTVLAGGVKPNQELLDHIYYHSDPKHHMCIEKIASYGMAVGATVFETCFWYGRFFQAWEHVRGFQSASLVERRTVKVHLCASAKAKEANVWQALVDRFGKPGTKKKPGTLYGVSSHQRAALALAVTVFDMKTVGML